jgi:SAM-dependent methyltransferase
MLLKAIDFDTASDKCCLCNSGNIFHYKTDYKDLKIYKCRKCGIKFLNPLYSDMYLSRLYSDYKDHDITKLDTDKQERRDIKHEFNIRQIEKFTGAGKLLSVGCGNGIEIAVALKRGWLPEGYEINKKLADELSRKFSVPIYSGKFTDLKLKKNNYDCIYFNHVIEHTKEPHYYLRRIHEILKPSGILFVATPNINGIANRIKDFMDSTGLRKNKGKHYATWQHLFYFSPGSMKYLLENHYGFRVLLMTNDFKLRKRSAGINTGIFNRMCFKTNFRTLAMKV